MTRENTVLIADDHPVIRRGLRAAIEADTTMTVVAEAENGAEAVDLIRALRPGLALVDLNMRVKHGLQVAHEVLAMTSQIDVIIVTMERGEWFVEAALELGVSGYVLKDNAMAEIVDCLRAVGEGRAT